MKITQITNSFKTKYNLIKQYLTQKKFIPSTLVLILITLELLIIGGLIIENSSTQRVYECQSSTPWRDFPIDPNDTLSVTFERIYSKTLNVASGQICSININTSDIACFRVFTYEIWNDDDYYNDNYYYIDNYYYVEENVTEFKLIIEPQKTNSFYVIFIYNPNDTDLHYEGKVIIQGFNQDHYILIAVPLIFLIPLIIGKSLIIKIKSLVDARHSNNKVKEPNSFLRRLSLLWSLNEKEFNKLYIIIIVVIIWFIVEPIIPIYEEFRPGVVNANLSRIDLFLIRPINFNFILLGVMMFIEASEVVSGKFKRNDIMNLFSLPISKAEWLFVILLRMLFVYGGIFGLLFFMKALLISLQTKLLLPINSFIAWFPFLMLFLLLWGIFGLLVAIRSNNQIRASILSITTLFIFSTLQIILMGNPNNMDSQGGIFNMEGLCWLKTSNVQIVEANLEFPYFLITPYLEIFYLDTIINVVLICICIILLVKTLRNFELS